MFVHGNGRLTADASGSDQIVFTGAEKQPGFWGGIGFQRSLSEENVLKNVVIEYGGSDGFHGGGNSVANLFIRGGDGNAAVTITGSTIRASGKYGISIEKDSIIRGCSNMTYENNTAAPTYNSHTETAISQCT